MRKSINLLVVVITLLAPGRIAMVSRESWCATPGKPFTPVLPLTKGSTH